MDLIVHSNETTQAQYLSPTRNEEHDIKALITEAESQGFVKEEGGKRQYYIKLSGNGQPAWYSVEDLAFVIKARHLHIIGKQQIIRTVKSPPIGSGLGSGGYIDGHHSSCTREHEDDELCCRYVKTQKSSMTPEEDLAFHERMQNPF